jgi:hypothetical protein
LVKTVAGGTQNPASTGAELAKKQAKRQRQKAAMSETQVAEAFAKKQAREHSSYLRLAFASYVRCPEDYYDSFIGIWEPPEPGVVFDNIHQYVLEHRAVPVPQLPAGKRFKTKSKAPQSQQQVVERAQRDDQSSFVKLVEASNVAPSGSHSAETGGTAQSTPMLSGRLLLDERAPTAMADVAHYTLTTQRDWTAQASASGIHEPAAPVAASSQEGQLLLSSRGYKILVSKGDHALNEETIQKKMQEQPPLVSIAFAWTKQAANKISTTKWLEKSSSSSSLSKPVVFVASSSVEGPPASAAEPEVPDIESDDDFVPFAWTKTPPAPGTEDQPNATNEDPLGLATIFSNRTWDQVENLEPPAAASSSSQTGASSDN